MSATWEYKVESVRIADRWSAMRQAEEIINLEARINSLGNDGWELISYESVPMFGSFSNKLEGLRLPSLLQAAEGVAVEGEVPSQVAPCSPHAHGSGGRILNPAHQRLRDWRKRLHDRRRGRQLRVLQGLYDGESLRRHLHQPELRVPRRPRLRLRRLRCPPRSTTESARRGSYSPRSSAGSFSG